MIIEKILDLETNKETIVEREMTAEEMDYFNRIAAEKTAEAQALATKEAARQAVLEKIGLTTDEAKLLLS